MSVYKLLPGPAPRAELTRACQKRWVTKNGGNCETLSLELSQILSWVAGTLLSWAGKGVIHWLFPWVFTGAIRTQNFERDFTGNFTGLCPPEKKILKIFIQKLVKVEKGLDTRCPCPLSGGRQSSDGLSACPSQLLESGKPSLRFFKSLKWNSATFLKILGKPLHPPPPHPFHSPLVSQLALC